MFDEKAKVAVVLRFGSGGPELIVVSGVGTTVQVWVAGVGSNWPALSTALTWRVCSPTVRPPITWCTNSNSETHSTNCARSRTHWTSTTASLAGKPNETPVHDGAAGGTETIVDSGRSSTAQVLSAGDRSRIPSALFARTSSVCSPSTSPLTWYGDGQAWYG